MMPLFHLVHGEVAHIDDEPLERQARVDRLDDDGDALDFTQLELPGDRAHELGDVRAYLRVSGLVDWHAVCSTAGERCGRVDLTDA
jgi:hypothetical protein